MIQFQVLRQSDVATVSPVSFTLSLIERERERESSSVFSATISPGGRRPALHGVPVCPCPTRHGNNNVTKNSLFQTRDIEVCTGKGMSCLNTLEFSFSTAPPSLQSKGKGEGKRREGMEGRSAPPALPRPASLFASSHCLPPPLPTAQPLTREGERGRRGRHRHSPPP